MKCPCGRRSQKETLVPSSQIRRLLLSKAHAGVPNAVRSEDIGRRAPVNRGGCAHGWFGPGRICRNSANERCEPRRRRQGYERL